MDAGNMRRVVRLVVVGIGGLTAGFLMIGTGGRTSATLTAAQATSLSAMGGLSGTVTSSKPFKAAQVYMRNVDKRIMYMVYTNAGQFRSVGLFPGNYEISVTAKGLQSDVQKLVVKAGDNPKINLSLRDAATGPAEADTLANLETLASNRVKVSFDGYDNIYPPGAGRDVAERTCIICHGENFLPSQPATEAVWNGRLDYMMGKANWDRAANNYAEGLLNYRAQWLRFSRQDRADLVAYLVKNFGPGAAPRNVRTDKETPLDEAKLGKALYMEYYVPADPPGQGGHAPEYANAGGAAGRRIQDVRFDADGNVWGSDRGVPRRLVKLNPRTGEMKEWVTPHPKSDVHEVLIEPSGMVWMPEHATGGVPSYLLGFNSKTEKWEQSIDLDPDNVVRNPIKWMQSQAFDSKGNLYVGWIMGGAISKYDRQTKKATVFPLPSTNAIPYGIVADRNDNIWIAMWGSGKVAKFDTHTNTWTEFTPPTYPGQTRRVNVDYQNNIWWGIWAAGRRPGKLAKLDQTTGRITEYTIPEQNAQPYDVVQDLEGNIWFPDSPAPDRSASIGKFNPKDQTFTFYPKPQFDADTPKIQMTKDGAIWYAPRGSRNAPAISVLYPDMDKITTFGAFYVNGPPGYPFKTTVFAEGQPAKPATTTAQRR
jgi:streptogramin lyase/mono/diheme cytochrome c family protein